LGVRGVGEGPNRTFSHLIFSMIELIAVSVIKS
jgi:hypothetical protein